MKSLIIALTVLAYHQAFAVTPTAAIPGSVTGSAEELCGGATPTNTCAKCSAAQKAAASTNALADWQGKCDAECVSRNRPPERCYARDATGDPKAPSPTCEQVGSPATDEKWKAEVTKSCKCKRVDC